MKANLEEGGSWLLIVGIKATYAIITVAILAILSAKLSFPQKNIPKLINPNSQRGRKMVAKDMYGILYRGIQKWAY